MKPQDNDKEQEPEPTFTPWDNFAFESYQALLKDRTILFNDDVKKDVIERIVLPLTTLSQKNNKPIKLLINSNGGSIEDGQAVVDAIITSKAPIITVAFGKAMSAAFDIFLSGTYRVVYPNTVLMCHSGSAKLENQTLPQINQEAKLHEVYFTRWSKWYASRTKISEKEWHTLLSTGLNRYFFPEEALKEGLVHDIIKIPKKNFKDLSKVKW
jgi:ATP-dependent Clp protease protease subunit